MKALAATMALIALIGLMVYTNPSKDDLSDYVRQYVMKESQKKTENYQGQILATFLGGIAGGLISSQTIRTDYVLFSTYELPFGKERFRALGIFKNFILLEKPDLKRLKMEGKEVEHLWR